MHDRIIDGKAFSIARAAIILSIVGVNFTKIKAEITVIHIFVATTVITLVLWPVVPTRGYAFNVACEKCNKNVTQTIKFRDPAKAENVTQTIKFIDPAKAENEKKAEYINVRKDN